MREILFRGKRLDNGEWVEGAFVGKYDPMLCISYAFIVAQKPKDSFVTWYAVDPDTVCQYTGLTDNVRQRIYEGDIVSILPDDGEMGVIKWADDEAMFVLEADVWCANFDNYFSTDLEVIGNIHDNPELLKGE